MTKVYHTFESHVLTERLSIMNKMITHANVIQICKSSSFPVDKSPHYAEPWESGPLQHRYAKMASNL